MNTFVDSLYNYEIKSKKQGLVSKNYFKFKTTIVLHMYAFLNREDIGKSDEE